MGYLAERVSYLRGLVDGINLDKDAPESRIFDEILELLDDMATSIEGLEEKQDEAIEELANTQEDVDGLYSILEDEYLDEDDDYDDDYDDSDDEDGEWEIYDEAGEYTENLQCPNCGEVLPVDLDLIDEGEIVIKCPECGEDVTIFAEFEDDDEDEEDCDGDCFNCPNAQD